VEEMVRDLNTANEDVSVKGKKQKLPHEYQAIKKQLDTIFHSKIDLSMNDRGKGKIVIPFKSATDLERIVKIIENQK
jgi:ParB family chromosome partitioning protein